MTREEAISRLKEGEPFSEICDPIWDEALDMAISVLSEDTRPNIHAHWEPIGEAFQCSHCGTLCAVTETATFFIHHINDKFCRGCGAVMDEKEGK